MSFEEPNNPRSSEIVNNQIQLTELATYEERTPVVIYNYRGLDIDVLLVKIMPPSWRAVFALVVVLTLESCVRFIFIAMRVVL